MWCIQNNLSNPLNFALLSRVLPSSPSEAERAVLAACYGSIHSMLALIIEHPHLRMSLKRYALQFMGFDHDTNSIVMLHLYNIESTFACQYIFSLIANLFCISYVNKLTSITISTHTINIIHIFYRSSISLCIYL